MIINRGVNISHDDRIEDYVTISPGINIAGNVIIQEGPIFGIGSSIREKIKIGSWSVIGGGAFVKEDVPEKTLYAGEYLRSLKSITISRTSAFKAYEETRVIDGKIFRNSIALIHCLNVLGEPTTVFF